MSQETSELTLWGNLHIYIIHSMNKMAGHRNAFSEVYLYESVFIEMVWMDNCCNISMNQIF